MTTLNPSDKAANAVLSNGNLTITTTTTPYSSARSTTSKSTGKLYFEVKIDSVGGTTAFSWGLANATASLTTIPGGTPSVYDSSGYSIFDASFRFGGFQQFVSLGTVANGIYGGVAIDFGNKNMWFVGPSGVWDGIVGDDPATNTGGLNGTGLFHTSFSTEFNALMSNPLYAMVSTYNNSQGTVNFGATAFHYTIPSGFIAWDGTATSARHQLIFN